MSEWEIAGNQAVVNEKRDWTLYVAKEEDYDRYQFMWTRDELLERLNGKGSMWCPWRVGNPGKYGILVLTRTGRIAGVTQNMMIADAQDLVDHVNGFREDVLLNPLKYEDPYTGPTISRAECEERHGPRPDFEAEARDKYQDPRWSWEKAQANYDLYLPMELAYINGIHDDLDAMGPLTGSNRTSFQARADALAGARRALHREEFETKRWRSKREDAASEAIRRFRENESPDGNWFRDRDGCVPGMEEQWARDEALEAKNKARQRAIRGALSTKSGGE